MKRHNYYLVLYLLVISLTQNSLKAQDQIVKLPNGQRVILYPDKTWDYYEGISYDFDFSTLEDNKIPNFLSHWLKTSKRNLARFEAWALFSIFDLTIDVKKIIIEVKEYEKTLRIKLLILQMNMINSLHII